MSLILILVLSAVHAINHISNIYKYKLWILALVSFPRHVGQIIVLA